MTNYIKNKIIEPNKINNVLDLKKVSKAVLNFILALYNSGWNLLVSDKDNYSFQQKVMLKFTPRIHEVKNKSKNNKQTDNLASFVKLPSPILVKTPKEVNEISKFFKKNS